MLAHKLKKTLKKYSPAILRAYNRLQFNKIALSKLENLQIVASGLDGNLAFIKFYDQDLKRELCFFGYPSDHSLELTHKHFISKTLKNKIKAESLQIAIDVAVRFLPVIEEDEYYLRGRFPKINTFNTYIESGAYTGIHAALIAKEIELNKFNGKVLAVESVPENFEILKKNIKSNNFEQQLVCINKAIWSTTGIIKLYRDKKQITSIDPSISKGKNSFEIDAISINDLCKSNNVESLDYLRLQINGAELDGLKGSSDYLNNNTKMSVAALYKSEGIGKNEIISYLKEQGIEGLSFKSASVYKL